MRRVFAATMLMGWFACFGYERPAHRNRNAIGAPSVTVGVAEFGGVDDVVGGERIVTEARVRGRSAAQVVLERAPGDRFEVRVGPMTHVTVEGRPVKVQALREGARVRASYVVKDGRRIADRIEVR